MPNWKKLIVSGSDASLNSLNVTTNVTAQSFTGSLFGTSSYSTQALSSSYTNISSLGGFVQGGNSFGTTATLGTNDNNSLAFETNRATRLTISNTGKITATVTSSMRPPIQNTFIDLHPESVTFNILPFYANDIAYNTLRGGTFTGTPGSGSTYVTSTSQIENMFDGAPTYATFPVEQLSGSYTASIVFPQSFQYGNTIGFSFGNTDWRAKDFTVEILVTGSYYLLDTVTNYTEANYNKSFGYSAQAVQGARITFSNFNNGAVGSGFRIADIYLLNYNGQGGKSIFVGRDGGSIYKSVNITGSLTVTGSISAGSITPLLNNTYNLGTNTLSYSTAYINTIASPGVLTNNTTNGNSYSWQVSASEKMRLFGSSGNLLLQNGGTFTDAGFRLDVSGSTRLNGNTTITGSLIVTNGITGSLSGSATNAVSASYALSSSYALTSSYAVSASYAVTSSYALTASYVNPLNQDLIITGSIIVTGGVTASNALITGNLSVLGTASFVYTTASVVTIGGNLITLNTDNPSVRFAGITVVDSGSFGNSSTGSLFWDSQNNRWIYSNPSGSSYDGGMFISGPRNTSGLGNEQGTTLNAILKGQGGDHLTSSGMFEDSSGNVGVGTASPSAKFEVVGNVKATSFTGSFSGSVAAPGATTQIVYNSGGALAADSGLVYSGSNVGIGISSPTDKLHIVSSATGNQFGRITATDANASAAWVAQNDQADNVVYRVFGSTVSGTQMGAALGRSASLLANLGGSGVFLLGTYSTTDFILGTNNTENMRITTAGNVGIGTTTPGAARLNVVSDNNSSNPIIEAYALNLSQGMGLAYSGLQAIGSNADVDIVITPKGTGKSYFSTGNVGIGTSSPSQKLEVSGGDALIRTAYIGNISAFGTDYASFSHIARTGSGDYSFLSDNNGITYINAKASNSIKFRIDNIDKAIIDSSGNVGIGTTSPASKLHLYGTGDQLIKIENTGTYLMYAGLISNEGYIGSTNATPLGFYTNNVNRVYINTSGNVGIGTTSPGYKLEVVGAVSASTYYGDGSNLTNISSGSVAAAGSDGQLQYNNGGSFGGASRLYYNDSTNRVGIGTSSPGYDLDVSGSARVQDRLRVGVVNTGNGVIHQSSDATINPTSATIVWSVPGSAGICAFIEYYVFNSNTGTSQRAGNIVTTWNASGTPQITHTETSTPDIGSTSPITFSTSLTLGGDPQLIATNSGGDIWYMIMNYRYF